MGGIILLFIILIWASSGTSKKGKSGDVCSDLWTLCFLVWLCLWIGWVVAKDHMHGYHPIYLIPTAFIALPSLWSFIAARLGWVKTSYYFALFSFFFFRRSQKAGAMYRGFKAAQRLKSNDKKREALQWLKAKFLNSKRAVYSGEMVMFVIIDAHLQKPKDTTYTAKQLKLLDGIGTRSIPGQVTDLAFKLAIVPSLTLKDYPEIHNITQQWNTNGKSPVQRYLFHFMGYHYRKLSYFSRTDILFWRMFIQKYTLLKKFSAHFKAHQAEQQSLSNGSNSTALDARTLALSNTIDQTTADNTLTAMLEKNPQWTDRAKDLGIWNEEEAWQNIEKSIKQVIQSKSGASSNEYDPEIERNFVNMRYVCSSVRRRLSESKTVGAGAQNFLDWFKLRQIMHELEKDTHVLETAFSMHHHLFWNWTADMWNQKKNRCLAHFIASICGPIAMECGHKDMGKILNGITASKFS